MFCERSELALMLRRRARAFATAIFRGQQNPGYLPTQQRFSGSPCDRECISLLQLCNQVSQVTQIHAHMIKNGLDRATFPLSKLLSSSTLDMNYARLIFAEIENPNLFNFNTMLRGYSATNNLEQTVFLLNSMRSRAVLTDQFTFICTLKACTLKPAIRTGESIHSVIVKLGFEPFINVRNILIHLYSTGGRIEAAHQLFDEVPCRRDSVSWNALMGGYLRVSRSSELMGLFGEMHMGGFKISSATIVIVLSACSHCKALDQGKSLHGYCNKNGFCLTLNLGTAILDMYAKCGCLISAHQMFDEIPVRDVVLWNCIIDGYVKSGHLEESMVLFHLMKHENTKPNYATLASLLSGCAHSGALALGQSVHKYVEEEGLELNAVLGTALIDMYSKVGLIEKAVAVFDKMTSRDVKCWTAMIAGLGIHGQAENVLQLFSKMKREQVHPNEVTFLAVLTACNHGGLVEEGKACFKSMIQEYGLSPKIEHYGCMIDLLGRRGLFEEACELIKNLPTEKDATTWRALLAACRVHGNVDLGEFAKRSLTELEGQHPADSILLSRTYAAAGRWDDVVKLRNLGEEKMIKKEAGLSSIEMD